MNFSGFDFDIRGEHYVLSIESFKNYFDIEFIILHVS